MKCEAEYLITKLNFPRMKRCTNDAICEYNGKCYCGIHDPVRRKKLQEKNESKKENTRKRKMQLHFAYLNLNKQT